MNNIDHLISKLFSNSATKEELEQLEVWKQEADENIDMLEGMRQVWENANGLKDYKEFDTNSAWNKLSSKMVDADLKSEKKAPSVIRRMLPLAASLILLIAAVFTFKFIDFGEGTSREFVTTEQQSSFKLEDLSSITLDTDSKLSLVSDFKNERIVSLTGRAHFDVVKDNQRPFVVKTHHGDIKVTGTQFSVRTNLNQTDIYLEEGSIVYLTGDRSIDIKPSDAVTIKNGAITKYRIADKNRMSWKTGLLVFDDQEITKVFETLSSHFNIDIKIDPKKVNADCKLNSTFDKLSLKEILNELSLIMDLKFETKDTGIHIKHLSC